MSDLQTIPILRSPDLAATQSFYETLGFAAETPGPDYLILRRPGIELHVCPPDHSDGRATESTCYIRGEGVLSLHEEWSAAGIKALTPIYHRAWGMYEFYISDPHGCLLKFGKSDREGETPDGAVTHPADLQG